MNCNDSYIDDIALMSNVSCKHDLNLFPIDRRFGNTKGKVNNKKLVH